MCNNTHKKKAAGAGKDFTLFFGVMLHFNFKCAVLRSPPNNVREPEPRAELPTSVVDDHNWDGVGRQTVKSTADWEGFQCL